MGSSYSGSSTGKSTKTTTPSGGPGRQGVTPSSWSSWATGRTTSPTAGAPSTGWGPSGAGVTPSSWQSWVTGQTTSPVAGSPQLLWGADVPPWATVPTLAPSRDAVNKWYGIEDYPEDTKDAARRAMERTAGYPNLRHANLATMDEAGRAYRYYRDVSLQKHHTEWDSADKEAYNFTMMRAGKHVRWGQESLEQLGINLAERGSPRLLLAQLAAKDTHWTLEGTHVSLDGRVIVHMSPTMEVGLANNPEWVSGYISKDEPWVPVYDEKLGKNVFIRNMTGFWALGNDNEDAVYLGTGKRGIYTESPRPFGKEGVPVGEGLYMTPRGRNFWNFLEDWSGTEAYAERQYTQEKTGNFYTFAEAQDKLNLDMTAMQKTDIEFDAAAARVQAGEVNIWDVKDVIGHGVYDNVVTGLFTDAEFDPTAIHPQEAYQLYTNLSPEAKAELGPNFEFLGEVPPDITEPEMGFGELAKVFGSGLLAGLTGPVGVYNTLNEMMGGETPNSLKNLELLTSGMSALAYAYEPIRFMSAHGTAPLWLAKSDDWFKDGYDASYGTTLGSLAQGMGGPRLYFPEGLQGLRTPFETPTPEDVEAFEARTEGREITAADLGFPSEEARQIVDRNITEQYEAHLPLLGRILSEELIIGAIWLMPVGGAHLLAEQRLVVNQYLGATRTVQRSNALVQGIRGLGTQADADLLLAAERQLSTNLQKLLVTERALGTIGGKKLVEKATREVLTDARTLERLVEKLTRKSNIKPLSAMEIDELGHARLALAQTRQQMVALSLQAMPPKLMVAIEGALSRGKSIGALPEIRPLTDVTKYALNDDWVARVLKQARSKKGLLRGKHPILKVLFPYGKAFESDFNRLALGYAVQQGMAESIGNIVASRVLRFKAVLEVHPVWRKVVGGRWQRTANSRVRNVKYEGKGTTNYTVNEVMEDADRYRVLSGEWKGKLVSETDEWKAMREVLDARKALLEHYGIELPMRKMAKGKYYFPHRVVGDDVRPAMKGVEKSQVKPRYFAEVPEGIKAGYRYTDDYRQSFWSTIVDDYKMISDKMFIDELEKLGTHIEVAKALPEVAPKVARVAPKTAEGAVRTGERTAAEAFGEAMNIPRKQYFGNMTVKQGIEKLESDLARLGKVEKPTLQQQAASDGLRRDLSLLKDAMGRAPKATEGVPQIAPEVGKALAELPPGARRVRVLGGLLEDVAFTEELATKIEAVFKVRTPHIALRGVAGINQALRFAVTGYDLGAPLIHGQNLFFRTPKAWAKAWWGGNVKAIMSERWMHGFVHENRDTILTAINRGHMLFDTPEFMQGAGIIKNIPVFGHTAKPAERAFTGFLDVAKIEYWRALYRSSMTDSEAAAIGLHIDKMLGSVSAVKMGMSSTQGLIETIVAFAPRYYRSRIGLMSDIFKGGVTGRQAARAFAHYTVGTKIAYYALAKAIQPITGEEPHMFPWETGYMRFKIADTWLGFGGFDKSAEVFLGRLVAAVWEGDWDAIPRVFGRTTWAKMSILARLGVDAVYGQSYIGESTADVENFIKTESKAMLPFWANAAFQENMVNDTWELKLLRGGTEILGATAYHVLGYQKVNDAMQKLSPGVPISKLRDEHRVLYDDLRNTPEIQALLKEVETEELMKGPKRWQLKSGWLEYAPARDAEADIMVDGINKLSAERRAGNIDDKEYWDGVKAVRKTFGEAIVVLREQHPEVGEYLSRPTDIDDDASVQYRAWVNYNDTVRFAPELNNPYLSDIQAAKLYSQLTKDFVDVWGREVYDRIRLSKYMGEEFDPMYYSFAIASDSLSLSGYYDEAEGDARLAWRTAHPEDDADLYFLGRTSTIMTTRAAEIAQNMIDNVGLPKGVPQAIDHLETQRRIDAIQVERDAIKTRAGTSWRNAPTQVGDFWSAASNLNNKIKADVNRYYNSLLESGETEARASFDQHMIAFDQLYAVIQQYAQTTQHPQLSSLLLQMESWRLSNTRRRGRVEAKNP